MLHLWRRWTEGRRSARKTRWLYAVMTLGFGALAVAAVLAGDATVAALAGVAAVATIVLIVLAPRLARWTDPEQ